MIPRRDLLLLPLLLVIPLLANGSEGSVVVGTYALDQMRAVRHLTFPRVLLYDGAGSLIDRKLWPAALAGVQSSA